MTRALVVLCLFAGVARADDPPWADGVPVEAQKWAESMFAAGNELFAQQAHAPALEKYKAAIAVWDHPLIRFNMAVTEIRLDRILDAADDLDKALRYGDKPFSKDLYQQALDYRALIKNQIGYVEVSCDQADVHILLDAKPWFTCAGTQKRRVLAGEHLIVGEGKALITMSRQVVAAGGSTANVAVELLPIGSAVVVDYRVARWVPYAVTGGGVAVGVAGLAVWFSGRSEMDRFGTDYATYCAHGCTQAPVFVADEYNGARWKSGIGIAMMGAGGAATIAGVVLTVTNARTRRVLPNVEVAPTRGGGAVSATLAF